MEDVERRFVFRFDDDPILRDFVVVDFVGDEVDKLVEGHGRVELETELGGFGVVFGDEFNPDFVGEDFVVGDGGDVFVAIV